VNKETNNRVLKKQKAEKKRKKKRKNQIVPITASGLQGEKPLVC